MPGTEILECGALDLEQRSQTPRAAFSVRRGTVSRRPDVSTTAHRVHDFGQQAIRQETPHVRSPEQEKSSPSWRQSASSSPSAGFVPSAQYLNYRNPLKTPAAWRLTEHDDTHGTAAGWKARSRRPVECGGCAIPDELVLALLSLIATLLAYSRRLRHPCSRLTLLPMFPVAPSRHWDWCYRPHAARSRPESI